MRYYFIATNYNNSHHTVNYINNVSTLSLPENTSRHIIIVDNQSVEPLNKIEQAINNAKQNNCEATLIVNPENTGYFKGLNLGLESINCTETYTAIIGNNDLIFDNDFLIKLHALKLKAHDYSIAPNVYLPNGKKQNPHVFTKPSKKAINLLRLYYKQYHFGQLMVKVNSWVKKIKKHKEVHAPMYIHGGIGAIYILTPNFFKNNKELNAPVFLYGEEVIFSHQIHSSGGKILYHPEIKVLHNEHSSVSKLGSKKLHKIGKESFKIFSKYY